MCVIIRNSNEEMHVLPVSLLTLSHPHQNQETALESKQDADAHLHFISPSS